jgi:hydroxymethylpyrimidine pyrophosphatase-like HAD family hydrolase
MRIGMVVSDLDGTLLDPQHRLSARDRQTLVELGERGITRVVATGRSLFAARAVLQPDVPIDYLVHSSGAGILSWRDQRPVRVLHMAADAAAELAARLVERQLDFMLHWAIPDGHHFYAYQTGRENADFDRRLLLYAAYAEALPVPFRGSQAMCQAVVIEPPSAVAPHLELSALLPSFQVIRSTSPLDFCSTWIEIFPEGVSKAAASAWLFDRERRDSSLSVAIGNDYNDQNMLEWADLAFVVANAPSELRARYSTVPSNAESGFSEAVRRAVLT